MTLSIIIPAYNERDNLPKTIKEVQRVCVGLAHSFEIIVIDDHSSDGTFDWIKKSAPKNLRAIRLSKQSGSQVALRAGFQHARGDAVIFLSADGQDDPNAIPEMVGRWQQGAQIVWALRHQREERFFKKVFALVFYRIIASLIKRPSRDLRISDIDFALLDRRAVDAMNACQQHRASLLGLLLQLGFREATVPYERRSRTHGQTKWPFLKQANLAFDWIISVSALPLRAMVVGGFSVATIGFAYALFIIWHTITGDPVVGWASTIVAVLILGGGQMMMLGILGEYLWKNLEEVKKRPLYFIEATTDKELQLFSQLTPRRSLGN